MEKGWVSILFVEKKSERIFVKDELFIAKILLFNTKKSEKGVGSQFFGRNITYCRTLNG